VQSRDLNTVADNPSTLGGGSTDKHLIYEGLSRIDADAVLAGAATARGDRMVFSVWHPELVRLRLERGHPRHPAQVIVSERGDLKFDRALIFQVPELPVFIVTTSATAATLRARLEDRPWIRVIDTGRKLSLARGLRDLRAAGIRVVSAVGGRRTATALLKAGLVDELYLTTSAIDGGEPHTPYYEGPALPLELVVAKAGIGPEAGVRFEHCAVRGGNHEDHDEYEDHENGSWLTTKITKVTKVTKEPEGPGPSPPTPTAPHHLETRAARVRRGLRAWRWSCTVRSGRRTPRPARACAAGPFRAATSA
jgi:riboflavin biosynthesis pyrimidine reductase